MNNYHRRYWCMSTDYHRFNSRFFPRVIAPNSFDRQFTSTGTACFFVINSSGNNIFATVEYYFGVRTITYSYNIPSGVTPQFATPADKEFFLQELRKPTTYITILH